MRYRAVLDIDLASRINDIAPVDSLHPPHVLFRYRGRPVSKAYVRTVQSCIPAEELLGSIEYNDSLRLAQDWMRERMRGNADCKKTLPPCTIAVCTRDRAADLRRCLQALTTCASGDVDIIVVDNDPPDDSTQVVAREFSVRYFRQARRGVNWARARAVQLARHDIVCFVDDDVVISGNWIDEIRRPFLDRSVGAVTGSVEPLELDTEGQDQHEFYSSFYRGFVERRFDLVSFPPSGVGLVGAGANMAVRKAHAVRDRIFEAELDGGTETKSGGDHYALYRVIAAGYEIVYAPAAMVWHRHRRSEAECERMLYGYSVGGYAVLVRILLKDRDLDAIRVMAAWFVSYHLPELWKAFTGRPGARPLRMIRREIRGVIDAPLRYWRAARRERMIGPLPPEHEALTAP